MKFITRYRLLSAALLSFALTSGCSVVTTVWKPFDQIRLIATEDVNPDGSGRSSPVQVRIYQLSSRTTFDNMSFDEIYFHGEELLSDELLSMDELILQPGESVLQKVPLTAKATHIAVVAAFRNLDASHWKFVYDIKSYGHYTHAVTISADDVLDGDPDTALQRKDPAEEKTSFREDTQS
ncbi:type VI secretion system lipoprotein TssJ [Oceanobacter mangrovi]|uniref:type VI secretion system lipoprotein TssJ n=1 Tax=Oceanobacter mangrovi TaxID=2862510 RepID=UPI001C8DB06F|nr:type VI secretion system lipoprotein TssJ [Oceanobacter mangrovi]